VADGQEQPPAPSARRAVGIVELRFVLAAASGLRSVRALVEARVLTVVSR